MDEDKELEELLRSEEAESEREGEENADCE